MADNEQHTHEHDEAAEPPQAARPTGGPPPAPQDAGSLALTRALKSSFRFLKWAMVLLVVGYLATGVFKVDVGQVKFKLRFGELVPVGSTKPLTAGSGLHVRWPWEEVVTVPTDEKTMTLDKEFWAPAEKGPDIRMAEDLDVRTDGYLLTGDANIVHMKLRVTYQVNSAGDAAAAYAFLVQDPEGTLRRLVKASAVKVVGSMPVMKVLNQDGLLEGISQELSRRMDDFQKSSGVPLGVKVVSVQMLGEENVKNPTEPGKARQAFFNAQNAVSDRNSMISAGQAAAENIINSAEAQRAETLASARGDALRLVRSAKADSTEMEQLLPIFNHSSQEANLLMEDFYQRILVEIMQQSPGAFVIHQEPDGGRQQLRFNFTRAPYLPKQQTAQQQAQSEAKAAAAKGFTQ
jgi:regulator of protease activity HflC (stomatin/prohibitin superfamily)